MWDLDATIIYKTLSLPDRSYRVLQLLKNELKLLICNATINVSQYDDVLNSKNYLKFHMLEVTEFSSDFKSIRQK